MQVQAIVEEHRGERKCPHCGDSAIQFIEGHPVCAGCGLVIDQAVQAEVIRSRRSGSTKRSEKLRSDSISREQRIMPNCIDVKFLVDSLRVSDSVEEKIALTIASIIDAAGKLGLGSDVIEAALGIYESLAKKSTFKGKSIMALSAAILYAASKKTGNACGLREVARAMGIKANKIFKCYRFILENLDCSTHYPSVEEYIARICGKLALSTSVVDMAKKIAVTAKGCVTRGAISSLAAASIYIYSIVAGERRTQREIADATGITETTLRSRYKEIAKELQIILTL